MGRVRHYGTVDNQIEAALYLVSLIKNSPVVERPNPDVWKLDGFSVEGHKIQSCHEISTRWKRANTLRDFYERVEAYNAKTRS